MQPKIPITSKKTLNIDINNLQKINNENHLKVNNDNQLSLKTPFVKNSNVVS